VGIFRQMKDMRDMVNAAPDLIEQAQQAGAQARQLAAAQQAAAQAQMARYGGPQAGVGQFGQFGQAGAPFGQPGAASFGSDFDPIDGVSLDQFVAVSKAVAAFGYDGSKLPQIAAAQGIPASSWENAAQGWNARLRANTSVAQRFSQLYRAS
jgi:hypothetical protein